MDSRNNNPFFLLLILCFSINTHPSFAADTMSTGESLTGNRTIISKDQNFALGFFTPGKFQKFYLGIWYYKASVVNKTVVWVVNREKPIKDPTTAELKLLANGNLVLFDRSRKMTISNPLNSTEAVLGNDGNLVLRDGSNTSNVIWESLNNPNNIWLHGGRLGSSQRQLTSQPSARCDVDSKCGSFSICSEFTVPSCSCFPGFNHSSSNTTDGCVRNISLQCGKEDIFLPMLNMKMQLPSELLNRVGSIEECQTACSNKCSCKAYSYASSSCSLWNGPLLNFQRLLGSDNTIVLYLRLAASEKQKAEGSTENKTKAEGSTENKTKKKSVAAPLVGAVAGILLLLGLVLILVILRCKKRTVRISKSGVEGSLVMFTYRDLQNATKNFSDKLGGGSFGSVFKGVLPDSTAIAVKKLEGLSQGEKQFRSEVSTIGTIQHVNLVRLRGFCSKGTNRLLVYDYMPKGSLDAHLFHPKDSDILSWKTRYEIALGTARGLSYLHEKCRDCIIHCDVKPDNILLDAEFCPHVADFGLAKLVGREFSRVLTTMRGTRGYLAPEWISGVAVTAKTDVYSYGMMLFEIISGKRNFEQLEDEKMRYFPTWAATKMTEGEDILRIADNRLEGNADVEQLTRACRIACWCIQDNEAHRPTMGQVVQILEGVLDVNLPPIPRFLRGLENEDNVLFLSESTSTK